VTLSRDVVNDDLAAPPKEYAMKFANVLTTKQVFLGCLCAGALAGACADAPAGPTAPSASTTVAVSTRAAIAPGNAAQSVMASFPRSGDLHLTKECPEYTGLAGSFCTITASNVKEIEVGSRVVYASDATPTLLDSDLAIDLPGPGNNSAFGHARLDRVTKTGVVQLSGGTGKFTSFHATLDISFVRPRVWNLDGTYSFDPRD
jgi:hypothetical protein